MTGTGFIEASADVGAPLARRAVGAFERIAGSRVLSVLAVLIVALVAFLPGLATIQPVDREEARFAVGSQRLLAGGNPLTIETDIGPIGTVAVGVHWVQALSAALLGEEFYERIVAYRLPSFLATIASALLLWWGALALGNPRVALLAALLFAVAPLTTLIARAATEDAVVLFLASLAYAPLLRVWAGETTNLKPLLAVLFWMAIGASLAVSGLLLPLATAATVLLLSIERRSLSWLTPLAPFVGLPLLLVAVVGWATLVWLSEGGSAAATSLFGDVQRFAPASFPYALPPGTQFLFALVGIFPALIVAILAVSWILDSLRHRAVVFSLAAALPIWVVAELAIDKGPTQVLLAVPPLSLLAAVAAGDGNLGPIGRWRNVVATTFLTVPAALFIISWAGFLTIEGRPPWGALPAQLLAIALGALAFMLWRRKRAGELVAGTAGAAALTTGLALFGFIAPDVDALRVSERAIVAARAAVACPDPQIIGGSYREPSLAFLSGPGGRFGGAAEAADFLSAAPCGVAIIDRPAVGQFTGRALDIGLAVEERGRVNGVNAGNGRPVELHIFARPGNGPPAPVLDP